MLSTIACMGCTLDPGTTSLLLPLAQATLLSAPILLRSQLRRGLRAVRARRPEPEGGTSPGTASDGRDAPAERPRR